MRIRADEVNVSRIWKNTGLAFVGGLCLLASHGCAVGPDFARPEAKVPAEWHGLDSGADAGRTVITSRPAELAEWWGNFNDPLLTSLVERAIRSNPDLRQAQSRIRGARASLGVASAGLWPVIDVNGQYTRSRTPSSLGSGRSGSDSSGTTSNFFHAGLDAAWEIDIFGGTRRNIEAAAADLEAAVHDRRDVLVSLVAEVGTNYANLRQYQQQIEIGERNLKAQQHTAEITRKRHAAGFVSGLDVANSQAQAAATASTISVLQASAQSAIFNMSVLLGMEPAALEAELSSEKPIPPTPPEIPAGLPSDLLRRRPDIRRSEAQVHAATARIGVATADLFPKFSLTGSFGFSSGKASNFADWGSRAWSWGPTATWPIFDAGRIRWNIEVRSAEQEQALLAYEKTILTALKDVETALVSYSKQLEHNRYLADSVENYRKAVDIATRLYVEGKTDFLNVLTAQRSLFVSEDALATSTRALTTDLIALYKALGGGWEKFEPAGSMRAEVRE